jgi:hypothetical protein
VQHGLAGINQQPIQILGCSEYGQCVAGSGVPFAGALRQHGDQPPPWLRDDRTRNPSDTLKANRSPCTLGRPFWWGWCGGGEPYKTRSQRNRAATPLRSPFTERRKGAFPYLPSTATISNASKQAERACAKSIGHKLRIT